MREIRRYYEIGNTALSPERIIDDPDYKFREERRKRAKRDRDKARHRENEKSLRMNRITAFSTCMGVILVSMALFAFVYLQNQVAASKKNIAALENSITEQNAINDATRSRIDASVNLTHIRDIAQNRMGMVYADSDHVVFYEVSGTDYMQHY